MKTLDLADPDNFVDGPPVDYFTALRREQPISWYDRPGSYGYWVFTRHEDVSALLADSSRFINSAGISVRRDEPQIAQFNTAQEGGTHPLSYTDAPEHFPLRKFVSHRFKPAMIKSLECELDQLVSALFSSVNTLDAFEFVSAIAKPLPFTVLAKILGIPEEYYTVLSDYLEYFEGVEETAGSDSNNSGVDMEKLTEANGRFFSVMETLYAERKLRQREDVISDLLNVRLWDKALISEQINGILMQLLIAGNETTRAGAGFGVQLFAENPGQFAALKQSPELLFNAVEEIIRLKSPIQYMRRTATGDCVIKGHRIKKGDAVYLSIASANRDEAVFDNSDQFDIRRDNRKVLGFGVGEHFCVGANLAKMELRALFKYLAATFSGIELVDGPVHTHAHQIIGLQSLIIKLRT